MGFEARIWASRLEFGPRDWDFGLETGIWASRLGFEGGGTEKMEEEKEEKEKIPHVRMHRSLTPLGPLPKKGLRSQHEGIRTLKSKSRGPK